METDQTPPDGLTANTRRKRERNRAIPILPEVRFHRFETTGIEVREDTATNTLVLRGTPIVYDTPYSVRDIFGEFEEVMLPGVAAGALARGADVRFLFNHDGLPLARSASGTLTLEDSPTALHMTASLDARQQLANDLAVAIERGDVSSMSIGFTVARDSWDEAFEHREIAEFKDFLDVSAVSYPASPTTSIAVAQRMLFDTPVESRARMRRIYSDLRAGKVLSQSNEDKLVSAVQTLHEVLGAGGVDPASLIDAPDQDADDGPQVTVFDDGTGGSAGTQSDGTTGIGYVDGTGVRAAALTWRASVEARKRRR